MNKIFFGLLIGLLAIGSTSAQQIGAGAGSCGNDASVGCGFTGPVTAQCVGLRGYSNPALRFHYAAHDRFHPRPHYAYSPRGIDATRINTWNQQQAAANAWHCDYSYWRWGVPTALVVPPTASFQSEYNWGVAQTKTIPIYHQFGRQYTENTGEAGGFSPTPYLPSGTYQFGVYPVRAPH